MTDSAPRQTPLLSLRGISRVFDSASTVGIFDIDLTVNAGDFIAIMGPSGSGKSTLLNVLGLLDRPTSGEYWIMGDRVDELPERQRDRIRSEIFGFVFQSAFVLPQASVLYNTSLGLRARGVRHNHRSAAAREALARFGVTHDLGRAARLLSGGERQRLAIARAVATSPLIVLADEPTGSLDSDNSRVVMEYLRELNEAGTTVIVVTHDAQVASYADRRIEISDGLGREISPPRHPNDNRKPAVLPRAEEPRFSPFRRAVMDDALDAFHALSSHLRRSSLLMLTFALGVAGLLAAIVISQSAAAQISLRFDEAESRSLVISVSGGRELLGAGSPLPLWISRLDEVEQVTSASYTAETGSGSRDVKRLSAPNPENAIELRVLTSSGDLGLGGADLERLSVLQAGEVRNAALVSRDLLDVLSLPSGPGSSLWINSVRVDVIGSYTPTSSSARTIVVSNDVLQRASDVQITIVVAFEGIGPAEAAATLPLVMDPANPGQFVVDSVADLRDLRSGIGNDVVTLIGFLSVALLVAAAVSAATTMLLSVRARSQEIALRRAVGLSRLAIARMFLVEGGLIGIYGGALGSFVGITAGALAARSWGWTPSAGLELAALGLCTGAVTGILSAAVPAWSAARQDPANTIRGGD